MLLGAKERWWGSTYSMSHHKSKEYEVATFDTALNQRELINGNTVSNSRAVCRTTCTQYPPAPTMPSTRPFQALLRQQVQPNLWRYPHVRRFRSDPRATTLLWPLYSPA